MTSLRLFLWMVLLLGGFYPLAITGIAQILMKERANGSILHHNQRAIGSKLIGQNFTEDRYFWPRPSANHYNPLPSGGTNWGPTSRRLQESVEKRKERLKSDVTDSHDIPSELLFASGSGLDPHISPQCAYFQLDRVARARKMERKRLLRLINDHIETRYFGFLGTPCINVLKLNLELDQHE